MRKTVALVALMLLGLLSGQGCPTSLLGPESPRDRASRICTSEMGLSNNSFNSLYSVAELDHRQCFGKLGEVKATLGACDSSCGGINWCVTGCYNCSVAIIDAVYGSSGAAKEVVATKADSQPAIADKLRQIAVGQIGH